VYLLFFPLINPISALKSTEIIFISNFNILFQIFSRRTKLYVNDLILQEQRKLERIEEEQRLTERRAQDDARKKAEEVNSYPLHSYWQL